MDELRHFNPEGSILRTHQLHMLKMLEYVDGICRKEGIPYWLSSGTLLGAVRHGGFIPWDDDLDIELLRDDYKKLVEILRNAPAAETGYVLQTNDTDKDYIVPFAKLRETGSYIHEIGNPDRNYAYRGIFIDIFPLEKTTRSLLRFSVRIQNGLYLLSFMRNDKWGLKRFFMNVCHKVITTAVFPMLRLVAGCYAKKNLHHTYGVGFYEVRDEHDIFPLREIRFEGKPFPAPKDTDAYLTKLYGEYRTIPDIGQIKTHVDTRLTIV